MSPLARPVALSGPLGSARIWAASGPVRAAEDSFRSSGLPRASSARLERIAFELTPLDREVLLFVQSLRLVTGNQLQRRFWPGDASEARAARRALARLAEWRVLDRLSRRRGGVRAGSEGFVYLVGPVGHRLLGRLGFTDRKLSAPGERLTRHTLAIAEAVVGLHEAERSRALELIEVQTEPSCWRPFLGVMGARVILKPDLFVRLGAGHVEEDRWFVEIDNATEATGTLAGKIKRYAQHLRAGDEQQRHGVYPRVIWAVPDVRRAGLLGDLLERQDRTTRRLHVVTTQEALVPLLTSEAQR